MSLHDDQTTDILDSSIGTIGAGGSYMVNAINPSLIAARGQLGYQISDTIIFTTEASQTLWGQGAPAGLNITFGVQARWGERQSKNPEKQSPSDYGKSNQGFVNYAFEARVVKVNDRMNLIKIDKGSQDGVELNQEYDVFLVKQNGATGEAVARARVTSVKPTEAALTITEFFREVWIEEGFLVKRPLQ
jgi:hypothetical protein